MEDAVLGILVVVVSLSLLIAAILDGVFKGIRDDINAKNPPSRIQEHQKVTYDGKVIASCYFVPYLRGGLSKWKKIHIKRLKYTTPDYTTPFSKSTKCASFDIASLVIKRHETITYHDIKLYPILVYDKLTNKEDIVYYCKKYHYPFNRQYLILGPLEDCKNLINDMESLGANTRHVVFTHFPKQDK